MTTTLVKQVARHIPQDEFPVSVLGASPEEWFVVGPRCLEVWWQFKGPRFHKFTDPYVGRVLAEALKK